MRVIVRHTSYYDWVAVPPDTKVTPADVAAGLAKPDTRGLGFLMRVTKKAEAPEGTYTMVHVREDDIIHKILNSMHPNQGRLPIGRKEALAQLLAANVMPNHAHPKHVTGFEVEDDGPDEKLFRSIVEPLTKVARGGTNEMVVDPDDLDRLVGLYTEAPKPEHHVAHLRAKFGVKEAS